MDPFVAHLARLCREHPTRSKWVFVPGHAIGRTIGDRLVLEGTDWANLRFITPLNLALRMGAPYLVEQGTDPSEEQIRQALIMRLPVGLPPGCSQGAPHNDPRRFSTPPNGPPARFTATAGPRCCTPRLPALLTARTARRPSRLSLRRRPQGSGLTSSCGKAGR